MGKRVYRVGTRGSALALAQTRSVLDLLHTRVDQDIQFQISVIRTSGDLSQEKQIDRFSNKGIFVRELEAALCRGEVDFVVHSAKDIPTELAPGLTLAAVLPREAPGDAWVGREDFSFTEFCKRGGRVGTSSFRRAAQLKVCHANVHVIPIRGNVETRLRKIKEEGLEGVVVAVAGLRRLGLWEQVAGEMIPLDIILPAVGQGTLALEIQGENQAVHALLAHVHDEVAAWGLAAERAWLKGLGGGCQLPAGAYASWHEGILEIVGAAFSLDGKQVVKGEVKGSIKGMEGAEQLGEQLADDLLKRGAREVLLT